jgi:hypothetical protein
MSVNYSLAAINNRLLGVVTTIDAGAGNGILNMFTSSGALAASFTLQKPSGTVFGGVLTFSGIPLTAIPTLVNGTLTGANITDSGGNLVVSGLTIGTTTSFDIIMPVVNIVSGQQVAMTAASITGS